MRVDGRYFGDLFDADDPLVGGHERQGCAQERRLSAARRPGDEDVRARGDEAAQEAPHRRRQGSALFEVGDSQASPAQNAQGYEGPGARDRREDRVHAHPAGEGTVGDGSGVVETHAARARHAYGGPPRVGLVSDTHVDARESPSSVHPRPSSVDEDVRDARRVDDRREGWVHAALSGSEILQGARGFGRAASRARAGRDRPRGRVFPGEEVQRATHERPPGARSQHGGARGEPRRRPALGSAPAGRARAASGRAGWGWERIRRGQGCVARAPRRRA